MVHLIIAEVHSREKINLKAQEESVYFYFIQFTCQIYSFILNYELYVYIFQRNSKILLYLLMEPLVYKMCAKKYVLKNKSLMKY